MSPKAPWIICHDGSGPKPFGLECERCGCFEKVKQPILVDGFLDKCREFAKVHKNCREGDGGQDT